jgi:phosphomannomutase
MAQKQKLDELTFNGRIVAKAHYVFTPEISSSLGSIHGSLFNQTESLVIERDYHNDSRMLKRAYTSGVMSTGVNLLNLGDCTFPMLQFQVISAILKNYFLFLRIIFQT